MSEMLIDNIRETCGENTAKDVSELAYKSTICILYAADVRERSPEAFAKECEAYKVRYPERNIEAYKKLMHSLQKDKFTFVIEPTAYFIDEAVAEEYTKNNLADVNESGSFPYVILAHTRLNQMYPQGEDESARLFLFNKTTRQYEEIEWDYNEATNALWRAGQHGVF